MAWRNAAWSQLGVEGDGAADGAGTGAGGGGAAGVEYMLYGE